MNNELIKLIEFTKSLNILFVEDNEEVRKQLLKFFKNFFVNIDVADDGLDALNLYENEKYDLIITDISMPRVDGIEFSKRIKDINKDQNILIISAHTENSKLNTLKEIGVFDILHKPVGYEKLIKTLSNFMKKYQQ